MKLQSIVLVFLVAIALVYAQASERENLIEDCFTNGDCAADTACEDQKCVNPCDIMCGPNTVCRVVSHMAECSCKPGYVPGYDLDKRAGPLENITECVAPRCTSNSECSADFSCIDGRCTNPCPGACGLNTACNVINHDVTCTCIPGFFGDPIHGCEGHRAEGECTSNNHCPEDKMCLNYVCQDPCSDTNCGENTVCSSHNHLPMCSCKTGYSGSPVSGCKQIIVEGECTSNDNCPGDKSCLNYICQDPCSDVNCGENTVCSAHSHLPMCSCKTGYSGSPATGCKQSTAEGVCTSNTNCPGDKTCLNNMCQDPCKDVNCGENTVCSAHSHLPMCSCKTGYSGSPVTGCKQRTAEGECTSNGNCPNDKTCLSNMCQDPCKDINCGENTVCNVNNHLPMCSCKTGYSGSPVTSCKQIISDNKDSKKSVYKVKKFQAETGVKTDWHGALLHCQSQGRRLASIETAEENNQVLRLIHQTGITYSNFWTAGTDGEIEGHWTWYTTGKPITGFSNWQTLQPDNALLMEDCLAYSQFLTLGIVIKKGYRWNDLHCSRRNYFICEYYE